MTVTGCFRDGRAGFSMLHLVGCRLRNPVWYIFVKTHNWGLGGWGYFRYRANDFCCSFFNVLSLFVLYIQGTVIISMCVYILQPFVGVSIIWLTQQVEMNLTLWVSFLQIACGIVAFLRKNFESCHVYSHLLFIWYLMHYPTRSLWCGWCLKTYWC